MPWQDRIREAAYTSPSGERMVFDYEDVRRAFEKKTTGYNFPDADGTYVQDLGSTGRQYPLRVFFSGPDYDLAADAFEALLVERGTGKLEHPIYGTAEVVPFGTVTRRDDLKTAANQAVIEVTFWETTGLVYPTAETDPAVDVLSAVEAYNAAAAEQFAGSLDVSRAVERATLRSTVEGLLSSTVEGLRAVAAVQDNVRRQFDDVASSVNLAVDTLIADPLSLAFQTALLIEAPARAAANISARLSAYRDLAAALVRGDGAAVNGGGRDTREANTFHARDLFASTYVAGSVLSVVNNQFETKPEALQAASAVLSQFDTVAAWRDDNYAALEQVDTGGAYQQLQEAVAVTAGYLVYISFSLKQERRLVLDRNRTIIDLCAELYGSVSDERLDFFINSNRLSGSEILEMPRGREVVYYV